MNKLNRLYVVWTSQPTDENLGKLLEQVCASTYARYARLIESHGYRCPVDSMYEDIASETVVTVWRSLPGYPGNDPLKEYKDFGKFAAFVRAVGQNVRSDMRKLKDNSMVTPCSGKSLEYLQSGLEEGYESPEPEDFYEDEDLS